MEISIMKKMKPVFLIVICFLFSLEGVLAWNTEVVQGVSTPVAAGGTVKVCLEFGGAPPVLIWLTIPIMANQTAGQKADSIKKYINHCLAMHGWPPARIFFEHRTIDPGGQDIVVCRYSFGATDCLHFSITDDNTGEAGKNGMAPTPSGIVDKYQVLCLLPPNGTTVVPKDFQLSLSLSNGISATVTGDNVKTAGQLFDELKGLLTSQGIVFSSVYIPELGRDQYVSQFFSMTPPGIMATYSQGWGDYFGGVGIRFSTHIIPTFTQWGLVILGLVLLGAGTVYVLRRNG
jgi:hypothetical protein